MAAAVLEGLAEQIERRQLADWESPQLVTHVWDLLRRCYLLAPALPGAAGAPELLRRICRLDPSKAIE